MKKQPKSYFEKFPHTTVSAVNIIPSSTKLRYGRGNYGDSSTTRDTEVGNSFSGRKHISKKRRTDEDQKRKNLSSKSTSDSFDAEGIKSSCINELANYTITRNDPEKKIPMSESINDSADESNLNKIPSCRYELLNKTIRKRGFNRNLSSESSND